MSRFLLAEKLIGEAGAALRLSCTQRMTVSEKSGPQDLVTQADKETEQFLRAHILAHFPQDAIVGEEFPHARGHGATWYIDPIDGTTNYISQRKNFAVSIACYQGETPLFGLVLDVAAARLYSARRGQGAFCSGAPISTTRDRTACQDWLVTTPCIQHTFLEAHPLQAGMLRLAAETRAVRSLGSVALELCMVAAGEADVFVAMRSSPWDHNAGRIIVEEAGGAVGALTGGLLPLNQACPVLACATATELERLRRAYLR